MNCPFCGWYVMPGAPRCGHCGATTPGHVATPGGWTATSASMTQRIAQIALVVVVGVVALAYVVTRASSVGASPTAEVTPTAPPTATPIPTPTPVPTIDPRAGITFGTLGYNANACFGQMTDSAGHLVSGAEIDLSLPVTNHGKTASEPIWIVVQPGGLIGSSGVSILKKSSLKDGYAFGSGIALKAPAIPAGKTVTLKASLFFEVAYRADYSIFAAVSAADDELSIVAGTAANWPGLWTSVNIC